MIRLASRMPKRSVGRRALLKRIAHPAKDIGPELIALVGESLGVGPNWQRGDLYERIGDEIMSYLSRPVGEAALRKCLAPVSDTLRKWVEAYESSSNPSLRSKVAKVVTVQGVAYNLTPQQVKALALMPKDSDTFLYEGVLAISWNKKGGGAVAVQRRFFPKVENLGFKHGKWRPTGTPDGSVVGSYESYIDSEGNSFDYDQLLGVTVSSNRFYATLKLVNVTEA